MREVTRSFKKERHGRRTQMPWWIFISCYCYCYCAIEQLRCNSCLIVTITIEQLGCHFIYYHNLSSDLVVIQISHWKGLAQSLLMMANSFSKDQKRVMVLFLLFLLFLLRFFSHKMYFLGFFKLVIFFLFCVSGNPNYQQLLQLFRCTHICKCMDGWLPAVVPVSEDPSSSENPHSGSLL